MPRRFNYTRAASALVESALQSDRTVAKSFEVSVRSIEYWRSRLKWDEQLQQEYWIMANEKLSQWVSQIPVSLQDAIAFVSTAAQKGDPSDPKMVEAITGAIAVLNEVLMIQESLHFRKN